MQTRVIEMMIAPEGHHIFSEMATFVKIEDEGGGEFVTVSQCSTERQTIRIDKIEWPHLRDLIDKMIGECRD